MTAALSFTLAWVLAACSSVQYLFFVARVKLKKE